MKRKPKIEYYWTIERGDAALPPGHVVNWRLVGGNGEVMCQSTQGSRDKHDAQRSVLAVAEALTGSYPDSYREVGPGRNPGVARHEGKGK